MQPSREVQQRVVEKLEACVEIANKHFINRTIRMPVIKYDVKGTRGGYVNSGVNVVHYNPILLMDNIDAFIGRTVPHELAHLITYIVFGTEHTTGRRRRRIVHGESWREVMRVLGAPTTRCHSYDTKAARTRRKMPRVEYTCARCSKVVTLGHRQNIKHLRGEKYWHKPCKGAELIPK